MPRQESRIRRFRIANLHLKKIFLVSVSLNGLKWMFILILTARFNKQTFLIIEHKVFFFHLVFPSFTSYHLLFLILFVLLSLLSFHLIRGELIT